VRTDPEPPSAAAVDARPHGQAQQDAGEARSGEPLAGRELRCGSGSSCSLMTSGNPPFKIVPRRELGEILLSSRFRVTISDREIISNSRVGVREDVTRNPAWRRASAAARRHDHPTSGRHPDITWKASPPPVPSVPGTREPALQAQPCAGSPRERDILREMAVGGLALFVRIGGG
jgi:hypothetical protein